MKSRLFLSYSFFCKKDFFNLKGYENVSKEKEELDRDVRGQSARWPNLQCRDCIYKTSSAKDLDNHAAKVFA